MWQRYTKKTVPQNGTAFFLLFAIRFCFLLKACWLSLLISVDFVDSKTRLGILKASFRLLSLLI